jgi:hypothetical protein
MDHTLVIRPDVGFAAQRAAENQQTEEDENRA